MSRIRSHRYITKIYNSSICTRHTQIIIENLWNITKYIIKPHLSQSCSNYTSIISKCKICTNHINSLTSKREYIISSTNTHQQRNNHTYRGVYFTFWQNTTLYIITTQNAQNENFSHIQSTIIVKLKTLHIQI